MAVKKTKPKPAASDPLYELHKRTLFEYYGKLEEVDLMELRRYCELVRRIDRITKEIDGRETVMGTGGRKPNPALSVLAKYEDITTSISRKLGLNLADRMAIQQAKRRQVLDEEKVRLSQLRYDMSKREADKSDDGRFSEDGGDGLEPSIGDIPLP